MNLADVAGLRLVNQQLAGTQFNTPRQIVAWLGAVQAQDYPMAKWALGIRLPRSTEAMIEAALDRGEILRTHVLRRTWHFVSADDIYWMLDLTAPRIKASMKSRHKAMGITDAMLAKSNRVVSKALGLRGHLSREKLIEELKGAGIPTDENKASHYFVQAELDEIICSGPRNGNTLTYALLEERVPKRRSLTREESLAKLARTYFSSRGPATVHDFSWWSGLSMADARNALEMVSSEFDSTTKNAVTYWYPKSITRRKERQRRPYLLPAYDEFIISYRDRGASIDLKHQSKTVSDNGIFRPATVIGGRVSALWKRSTVSEKVVIDVRLLRSHSKDERRLIQKAGERFGEFIKRDVEMNFGSY